MNPKAMQQMTAIGITIAGVALTASGFPTALEFWHSAAAVESATPHASEPARPPASEAPKPPVPESAKPAAVGAPPSDANKKKSKKPVPKPMAVEPLTPEEATQRAADPKAPSGALIVKPPEGKGAPAPAAGSPSPPAASSP